MLEQRYSHYFHPYKVTVSEFGSITIIPNHFILVDLREKNGLPHAVVSVKVQEGNTVESGQLPIIADNLSLERTESGGFKPLDILLTNSIGDFQQFVPAGDGTQVTEVSLSLPLNRLNLTIGGLDLGVIEIDTRPKPGTPVRFIITPGVPVLKS